MGCIEEPSPRCDQSKQDGDFGTLPFLNCPIPFPGRKKRLSSSNEKDSEGTRSLGGNAARVHTLTYVYIRVQRERVERRRRRRRQGWAASFLLLFPDVLQWKRLDEARLLQLSTARELQKRRLDLRPLSRLRQFRGRYRSGYDVFHAQCLEEKLIRKDE